MGRNQTVTPDRALCTCVCCACICVEDCTITEKTMKGRTQSYNRVGLSVFMWGGGRENKDGAEISVIKYTVYDVFLFMQNYLSVCVCVCVLIRS